MVKQNIMCKDCSTNGKGEVWKEIEGYENYAISNYGNVWSYNINRKMSINKAGSYSTVGLRKYKGAKQDNNLVHRLVAQAFIPNPENKPQVNHIDENKMNNHFNNLEWATLSENYGYNNLHQRRVKTRKLSGYYDSEKFKIAIKNSAKTRSIPIKGINIKTGDTVYFESAREAGRNGFHQGAISACLRGEYSQHRGYKWYIDRAFEKWEG